MKYNLNPSNLLLLMKLKIPPAFQMLFFIGLMWGIARLTNIKHFDFPQQKNLSRLFFAMGITIGIAALYAFRKARTTVDPTQPEKATKLVVMSIYKLTRNPMYLGMLLILIGFAIRLGNIYSFLGPILYVWYISTYQIKPEEEALLKLFGEEYTSYCRKVRRWI